MDAADLRERWTNRILVGATIVVVVCGALLFVTWLRDVARGYEPDCDSYSFERDEWRGTGEDSREHQAEALAECDSLVGLTRPEVTAMLGPHSLERRIKPFDWGFSAGWVNDGFGPGDGQMLYVQFGDDGRVTRGKLAYPQ
jgi:hypothetical protein